MDDIMSKLVIVQEGLFYKLWTIFRLFFILIECILYPYYAAIGFPEELNEIGNGMKVCIFA
jgi:ATP/ADP translocase